LIYEHFLSVGECNADLDYDEVSPHACQWIATKRTVKKVSTATYRQRLNHLRILDVCHIQSTDLCRTFIRFRASRDNSAGDLLLLDIDQRGLCVNLATSSAFLHTLSIHGCHMMTISVYLVNMYDFRVNLVVFDIRALSVSWGVQC